MAENKYHPIDINNWDRRDLYDHFSRLKLPHFAVAAYIDVTRLLEYKRHEGLSFYLSLIYLTTKVLNGIDNFRLRIIDGQVVSFDTIHTNFTHKRPEEEVFRFHTAPFEGTLRQYVDLWRNRRHPQCGLLLMYAKSRCHRTHQSRHGES